MNNVFFSVSDAQNFAASVGISDLVRVPYPDKRDIKKDFVSLKEFFDYKLNISFLSSFALDGLRLVPVIRFYDDTKGSTGKWYICAEDCRVCLYDDKTGHYFTVRKDSGVNGRYYMFLDWADPLAVNVNNQYFKTELHAPNKIGVPNAKKVRAWVSYLSALNQEQREYISITENKKQNTIDAIKRAFPGAYISGNNVHIKNGVLVLRGSFSPSGKLCYQIEYNYGAVDSLEDFLTHKYEGI